MNITEYGFSVVWLYDVALEDEAGTWDNHYTCAKSQHNDKGTMAYVAGVREGCVESRKTFQELLDWCYENGWSKPATDI